VFVGVTLFAVGGELGQVGYGDQPGWRIAADFVGGWVFLCAGLVAWDRRPTNRIGPLMVVIAVTWFVGTWGRSGGESVSHVARSFQGFQDPLLGVLVLAYPSGRLTGRLSRLLAVGWLADQAVWSAMRLVLDRPLSWYGCATCPETVTDFIANRDLLEAGGRITLALAVLFGASILVLTMERIRTAGSAARGRLLPIGVGAAASLLGVVVTGSLRLSVVPALFGDPRVAAGTYLLDVFVALSVLVGLLQERIARGAVADVIAQLGADVGVAPSDPRSVRDALARALHDPSLTYYPYEASSGTYLDLDGRPVAGPRTEGRGATVLEADGERLGLVVHDPVLLDDPGLVSALSAAIRLQAENARLAAAVQRQLTDLEASRARIVAATDQERRRVERDLHDGAQQRLISLSMELGRLRHAADEAGDQGLRRSLDGLSAELDAAIHELRELARGILPPILTAAGLGPAVESLAIRAPLPVETDIEVAERFTPAIESTAYFVVAEGLANVARHARAHRARVIITQREGCVAVAVEDDGIGGASPEKGSGIQGLIDRVGALGGRLTLEPVADGGTRLTAEIPTSP
jgi:signal transduction histidine kinase